MRHLRAVKGLREVDGIRPGRPAPAATTHTPRDPWSRTPAARPLLPGDAETIAFVLQLQLHEGPRPAPLPPQLGAELVNNLLRARSGGTLDGVAQATLATLSPADRDRLALRALTLPVIESLLPFLAS